MEEHPHGQSGEAGRICLVTAELAYLHRNGGIGTATWHLALALAEAGYSVHVLDTGEVPDAATLHQTRQRLLRAGVGLTMLQQRRRASWMERFPHDHPQVALSEWVAQVLGQLHQEHRFDLIEFPELNALGFRVLQARRTGLGFAGPALLVKLHSSNQWCREANRRWMHSGNELILDYCERYCFEQADFQLAPCRYMLDYADSVGWPVRDQARVVPYVYPRPLGFPAAEVLAERSSHGPDVRSEVVYFGRLETRKGLELFLQAARQLDPLTPITFLGSLLPLTGGVNPVKHVQQQLGGRAFQLHPDLNQEQALRYLLSRPCLAVIPSLIDNYPNTVIECVTHRIPFVATRVGGIPEIITDPELDRRLLCEPTAEDLLHTIRGYLASPGDRRELLDRLGRMVDVEAHNRQVVAAYDQILEEWRERQKDVRSVAVSSPKRPLVTVAVAGSSPVGLAETLESLRGQTHDRLEVLVLDGPALVLVGAAQRGEWLQHDNRLRWVDHDQTSEAGQWQEALQEARGEFFLPLVAGTLASSRLIEKLVRGLRANDLLAGLTCQTLGYHDVGQLTREEWVQSDRPTGGSRVLACLENVFGEGPSLYRTAILRTVGGFDQDAPAGPVGWGLAVKLLQHGYPVDILPELLARVCVSHDNSRRMTERYQMHRHLLERCASTWTLAPTETVLLWSAVSGMHQTIQAHAKCLGRVEKLRRLIRRVGRWLGGLLPESGQRWLGRALRGAGHCWRWATGKAEPWRQPIALDPSSQRAAGFIPAEQPAGINPAARLTEARIEKEQGCSMQRP